MSALISNKKGMTLIEVMIAIIITMIGALTVLSLQPSGYILAAKSDQLGRAAMILSEQLANREASIVYGTGAITTGTFTNTVYPSGQASALQGDVPYSVVTTITLSPGRTDVWDVRVSVTSPINNAAITKSVTFPRL